MITSTYCSDINKLFIINSRTCYQDKKINKYSHITLSQNKFQLQTNKMKSLLRKKPRNEPIKSPSPDIANRSIIKNTTIEVEDIRMKFKKAEEKQMKFELQSSLSHITPSDHASIQIKYRQLYDEYNRLRSQIKNIGEQNKVLNQENGKLVVQVQKNKGINQSAGAVIPKNEDQFMKEDYYLLKEEKRRLEQELKLEKERTNQSIKNNESLLLDQESLKQSLKQSQRAAETIYKIPLSSAQSDEEKRFVFFSNNMLSNYETRINAYLNQLNSRINKVELMEKMLKEKHQRWEKDNRTTKTPASYKAINNNWTYSTGVKYDTNKDYPLSQQRPNPTFPHISSPFRVEESAIDRRDSDNSILYETIRLKDAEISRLKIEKQKLTALLNEYEKDKIPLLTPKFKDDDSNITKKISFLQESLRFSKDSCQEYYNLNSRMHQKLANTEANFAQERKDLTSKIQYQQKIIKHYQEQTDGSGCPQCGHLEEEIGKLMTDFKQAEQRYEQNLTQLRNSIQSSVTKYNQELQHSEFQSSCRLKQLEEKNQKIVKQNIELHEDNQNYMRMLQYIKNVLHVDDIRDLLEQNTNIYTEVETAYRSEMEQIKYQMAAKEDENAELERKYKLKSTEAQLLAVQLERVRRQNSDLRSHNLKMLATNLPSLSREKLQNNHLIFFHNNDVILQKVRTSEQKVDILYQKINNSTNLNKFSFSSNFRSDL